MARRTLYGCVDWNIMEYIKTICLLCRTLYGCVDWNNKKEMIDILRRGRTLYGCVDWNMAGGQSMMI